MRRRVSPPEIAARDACEGIHAVQARSVPCARVRANVRRRTTLGRRRSPAWTRACYAPRVRKTIVDPFGEGEPSTRPREKIQVIQDQRTSPVERDRSTLSNARVSPSVSVNEAGLKRFCVYNHPARHEHGRRGRVSRFPRPVTSRRASERIGRPPRYDGLHHARHAGAAACCEGGPRVPGLLRAPPDPAQRLQEGELLPPVAVRAREARVREVPVQRVRRARGSRARGSDVPLASSPAPIERHPRVERPRPSSVEPQNPRGRSPTRPRVKGTTRRIRSEHTPKAGVDFFFSLKNTKVTTSERPSRLTPEEPRFFPQVYDARRAAESRVGQLSVAARERARRVSQPPKRTARRCKRICLCEKSKARYVTTYPVVSPRPATRTYPFLFRRSRKRSGFSVQRARLGEGAHRV